MEVKKNPKFDLRRKSLIFFQIGMIVILFFTWRAMELKTYERMGYDSGMVEVASNLDEVIPVTEQLNTPPPPPPPPQAAPVVIVEVENESDIEESVIESTEANQNADILDVAEIIEEEVEEEIVNVPFAVIEEVPIYPGCEDLKGRDAKRDCMSQKVMEFVQKNFNTDLATELGLEGRQRIAVQFKINKSGEVIEVRARAPHSLLENEAVTVVSSLPNMTPGMQRGKPVGVLYSLPIVFEVINR